MIVYLGPVYFGGLIFARLIENETRLYEAYGSNVLGAVLGGTAEYLSLVLGFRFLLALALAFYLGVFVLLRRRAPLRGASLSPPAPAARDAPARIAPTESSRVPVLVPRRPAAQLPPVFASAPGRSGSSVPATRRSAGAAPAHRKPPSLR